MLEPYNRSPQPPLTASQQLWLDGELRKIQLAIQRIVDDNAELRALIAALEVRVSALEP